MMIFHSYVSSPEGTLIFSCSSFRKNSSQEQANNPYFCGRNPCFSSSSHHFLSVKPLNQCQTNKSSTKFNKKILEQSCSQIFRGFFPCFFHPTSLYRPHLPTARPSRKRYSQGTPWRASSAPAPRGRRPHRHPGSCQWNHLGFD